MIESILLATTQISTFVGFQGLTNATGFFFERDGHLFLITNRHVVLDEPTGHRPDRIEIKLHTNPDNVAETVQFSIPLYVDAVPVWREAVDAAGTVDVVAIALEPTALPTTRLMHAFNPAHLLDDLEDVEVGARVTIVGFPLGFHDTFHHLPVARQAVIASSFGIRFQGQGYFLTDARMHRGTSGAPVVLRLPNGGSGRGELPWRLLGVHAARFDVDNRDETQDARLDLNCAWYADALLVLTG